MGPSQKSEKLKVFISSTMKELSDIRKIVAQALLHQGINAWIYEADAGARPESVITTSLDEIADSDIYVGLFWEKYGKVTVQEFQYACALKKPCFIYIRDQNCQREQILEEFLQSAVYDLQKGVTYSFFDSPTELGTQTADDIRKWLVRRYREMTIGLQQKRVPQNEITYVQDAIHRFQATSSQNLPQGTAVDYLAQQMRTWFQTLNYSFERHEMYADTYFEWIINVPNRRSYDRILVRGIDSEVELHHVIDLRQSVNQQKVDEGWLVAVTRVSPAAQEETKKRENRDLFCYTLDGLLDERANFDGYLKWLEAEVKQKGIDESYVDLACTKEEFDPITKQKLGDSRHDERNGWIDGYIDRWLYDPSKEHISILGEFGTGKTWFTLHYAWKALQRYRDAKERGVERPRLPLVIRLRDYAKAVSVESLFSEFFFRKYEIPLPGYSAFEQLNRMGKLLLIFDGFDEMADKVDRQKMINNFWELARVVVPGAKVILTCRTEHFPEAKEGRALLNAELKASIANLTGEPPQFEVLELLHFNEAQIRKVLSFRTVDAATIERVINNRELLDLARRPLMTELILDALPEISRGRRIDLSRVYLYAVQRKMMKDITSARTFTSLADKLYFLCELSWEMLSTNQMSLNYRLFPDRLQRLFGSIVKEQKDLDHWHYDMMGQTMLIRNADGDYTPAHRSLLEFFVAYKLAAELGILHKDFFQLAQEQTNIDQEAQARDYSWFSYFSREIDEKGSTKLIRPLQKFTPEKLEKLAATIGKEPFTQAILELMKNMLDDQNKQSKQKVKDTLLNIIYKTRDKTDEEVGCIGGNITTLLLQRDPLALKRENLSKTNLNHADFSYADLTAINLRYANLQHTRFQNSILGNANLRDADLTDARFIDMKDLTSVTFSHNSMLLISGGSTGHVWDALTGELKTLLRHEHQQVINQIVFDTFDNFFATISIDQVHIWNVQNLTLISTITREELSLRELTTLCFDPTREGVITIGGNDGIVTIDLSTNDKTFWQNITQSVQSLRYFSDGQHLAGIVSDSHFVVFNLDEHAISHTIEEDGFRCKDISISPDNTFAVLCWEQLDSTLPEEPDVEKTFPTYNHFPYFSSLDKNTEEALRNLDILLLIESEARRWEEAEEAARRWREAEDFKKSSTNLLIKIYSITTQPLEILPYLQYNADRTTRYNRLFKALEDLNQTYAQFLEAAQTLNETSSLNYKDCFQNYSTSFEAYKTSFDDFSASFEEYEQQSQIYEQQSQIYEQQSQIYEQQSQEYNMRSDIYQEQSNQPKQEENRENNKFTVIAHSNPFSDHYLFRRREGLLLIDNAFRIINQKRDNFTYETDAQKIVFQPLNYLAFFQNNRFVAAVRLNTSIQIIDVVSGMDVLTLSEHQSPITTLALSPDGSFLASGARDSSVKIWDVRTFIKHNEVNKDNLGDYEYVNSDISIAQKYWPSWWKLTKLDVPEGMVPNPDFGKCLHTIEHKINCKHLQLTGAKGLMANAGSKTLGEWLEERGGIL